MAKRLYTPKTFSKRIYDETIPTGRYWIVARPEGVSRNYLKFKKLRQIEVFEDESDDEDRQMGIKDLSTRKWMSPGVSGYPGDERVFLSWNRAGEGMQLLGVFKTEQAALDYAEENGIWLGYR